LGEDLGSMVEGLEEEQVKRMQNRFVSYMKANQEDLEWSDIEDLKQMDKEEFLGAVQDKIDEHPDLQAEVQTFAMKQLKNPDVRKFVIQKAQENPDLVKQVMPADVPVETFLTAASFINFAQVDSASLCDDE